jgi:CRISPR-associated protein Csx1
MLGLAMGIIRVLEKHGICKEIKEGVYLRNIEKLFAEEESSIYGYFGLKTNIPYLQQEIQNNFLDEKKRDSITNEWKLLRDIAKLHDESINPRNVVAHCGFEKNITEVKKSDNGDIVIRYTSYYKEPTKEKEKEKKNEYNSLKEIFKEKIVKGVLLEYKHTD